MAVDDEEPHGPTIRLVTPSRQNHDNLFYNLNPDPSPETIRLSPSQTLSSMPPPPPSPLPSTREQQHNELAEQQLAPKPAFIFGSPTAVSTESQFGSVADRVLREMHRRVATANGNNIGSSSSTGTAASGGGSFRTLFGGRKPAESEQQQAEKKQDERFEGKHKRQFEK
jgi:hypothetical protein